ncbi:hypothetical protein JKP88DRAFT_241106 [Tribonema minus]|uniref:MYND-type domain-containing protein n=1 Tax=Tribonema minus TaxID=303371 RepID=A0A835ZCK5_9STRA|nr:hypothetical protein JKP88DRAFT_241106 [Tribonema minus]
MQAEFTEQDVMQRIINKVQLNSDLLFKSLQAPQGRCALSIEIDGLHAATTLSFHEYVLQWLTVTDLMRNGRWTGNKMKQVETYDTASQFVVIVQIYISKCHRRRERNDCISCTSTIHRDSHKLLGDVPHEIRSNHMAASAGHALLCGNPGCDARDHLKRRKVCEDARYCSVQCQHTDWKAHKLVCRSIAEQR